MAYTSRQSLHRSIGQFIERRYATETEQYVHLLAFHFGQTNDTQKQRRYYQLAGTVSKRAYANESALDYFKKLLPLLDEAEQGDVWLEIGTIQQHIGDWEAAESAFNQTVNLAKANGNEQLLGNGRLSLAKLLILSRTQSDDVILSHLQEAETLFAKLNDAEGSSQVLEQLGFAALQQGAYVESREYTQRFLEMASAQNNVVGLSVAHENLGLSYLEQGQIKEALHHLQTSLSTAEAFDYLPGVILASNDLAGAFWMQGEYTNALNYLHRALTAAKEIGYKESLGLSIGNAGSVYQFLGNSDYAMFCYQQALQLTIEIGDIPNSTNFVYNIAYVKNGLGEYGLAEAICHYVIEKSTALEFTYFLCHCENLLGDIYAKQDKWGQAKQATTNALRIAKEASIQDILLQGELRLIVAQVKMGEVALETAVSALHQLTEKWSEPEDQAAIYLEIFNLDRNQIESKNRAVQLYEVAYQKVPNALYRQHIEQLSQKKLPPLPQLPQPDLVVSSLKPVEILIAQLGIERLGD
ncbi:MAG: tetratricopeptide repeat protein, partial [Chloroflexota bacterium]